jgi:predicted DNA-binding ribbon-helix-helix protein
MLEKRSVSLSGHRTSIALEPEFWAALEAVAAQNGVALVALISRIDETRTPEQKLASALRVFVLKSSLERNKVDTRSD